MKNMDRKARAVVNNMFDITTELNSHPETKAISDIIVELQTQFIAVYTTSKLVKVKEEK